MGFSLFNLEKNLYQRFTDCAHLFYSFLEPILVNESSDGSPILFCAISTIMPLISKDHPLQLYFTTMKGNETSGKMCNARVQQLIVPFELPHGIRDKCMVMYVFGDVLALFNGFLDKCEFVNILKHQSDAMGSTWSPMQCGVPLH